MTQGEHAKYWRPARLNFQDPKFLDDTTDYYALKASQKLAKCLGLPYPRFASWDSFDLSDELKNKLLLLAGPHWKTIAVAMTAKREEENASRLPKSD